MIRLTPIALMAITACASPNAVKSTSSQEPGATTIDEGPDNTDDDSLYQCRPTPGPMLVSLKPKIELSDLAIWAMAFSCKNIVYRSELASSQVTVLAPNRMSATQAWNLFVVSVESMGLAVDEKHGVVTITGQVRPALAKADDTSAQNPYIVAEGIEKVDDNYYLIERSLVDAVLKDPAKMGRGTRIVPSTKDGLVNGFKLFAIRPQSLYVAIGLRNGDTINSINGHHLSSLEKALEAYAQTRDASEILVWITRRRKPIMLRYSIR